ncbi:Protein CBG21368 [Caenorhabditis briggsae]|uniref:Protein CBG21368 n=1 Tax=Caenorhabditis briggsae TaxID=6238 RepID=A8XZY1_CAEBR|nr:Protein CBG21368 [Caenorhabditis briggsae]CAP38198.1 Protein CBG21368 [Caenorhabditis briggsae]
MRVPNCKNQERCRERRPYIALCVVAGCHGAPEEEEEEDPSLSNKTTRSYFSRTLLPAPPSALLCRKNSPPSSWPVASNPSRSPRHTAMNRDDLAQNGKVGACRLLATDPLTLSSIISVPVKDIKIVNLSNAENQTIGKTTMSTPMEVLERQLQNFVINDAHQENQNPEVTMNELKEQNRQLQEQAFILQNTIEKLVEEKAEVETAKDRIEDYLHMEIQNSEISRTTIQNLQAQIVWLHAQLQEMHSQKLWNFSISESENFGTSEAENLRTSEFQNLRISELQNFRISGPQNLRITYTIENCKIIFTNFTNSGF